MNVMILGWYGTETIGDRAILAGLFSILNKTFSIEKIFLGSLFPFFTERTINEDYSFYKKLLNKDLSIEIFNSQNSKELDSYMGISDFIIMGGGPLMDLNELYMIEYAFKRAKLFKKLTGLVGCGIGPLYKEEFKKVVIRICDSSDFIILRDNQSKINLYHLYEEFGLSTVKIKKCTSALDLAVEVCRDYISTPGSTANPYIAINLRDFPNEYGVLHYENINTRLKKIVSQISELYNEFEVKLVPMHYFHVGNDDRAFLNNIALELNSKNISVQNKNLTLEETMCLFQNAFFNVGMRYHSIVLQTLLSGKNYILDYTEPFKGKTYGFIHDIDIKNFYDDKYLFLQHQDMNINFETSIFERFVFSSDLFEKNERIYTHTLQIGD